MDDILRGLKDLITGDDKDRKDDELVSPDQQPVYGGPGMAGLGDREVLSSDEDPYGDPGRDIKSSDEDPYGDPGRSVKSSDEDPYGDPGRR